MKKNLLGAAMAMCACAFAMATNPLGLDHNSLMQKHDQEKPKGENVAPDEEDVYFILTGEAEKAIASEDYYEAALRLQEAINIEPDNPSNVLLLSNLGLVYTYLDKDSMALAAYDQALAMAPAMTTILGNRGKLKLKMGRDGDAWNDFGRVLERDSLNAEARFYHGLISLYAGDLTTAEADFSVLKVADPESYNTNVALSSLYSLTGRDREAIPYFKKLIEQEPAAEYYSALAGCYLQLGELSEAAATLSQAFRECGEDPELYYYRAWLNRESYLNDAAKADAKRAVELGADPARVQRLFVK